MELPRPKLSFSRFAQLHGVSPKTLDRWVQKGILPQPTYVCGRKFFDAGVVPQRGTRKQKLHGCVAAASAADEASAA